MATSSFTRETMRAVYELKWGDVLLAVGNGADEEKARTAALRRWMFARHTPSVAAIESMQTTGRIESDG